MSGMKNNSRLVKLLNLQNRLVTNVSGLKNVSSRLPLASVIQTGLVHLTLANDHLS